LGLGNLKLDKLQLYKKKLVDPAFIQECRRTGKDIDRGLADVYLDSVINAISNLRILDNTRKRVKDATIEKIFEQIDVLRHTFISQQKFTTLMDNATASNKDLSDVNQLKRFVASKKEKIEQSLRDNISQLTFDNICNMKILVGYYDLLLSEKNLEMLLQKRLKENSKGKNKAQLTEVGRVSSDESGRDPSEQDRLLEEYVQVQRPGEGLRQRREGARSPSPTQGGNGLRQRQHAKENKSVGRSTLA
jgi:hypothetical protein